MTRSLTPRACALAFLLFLGVGTADAEPAPLWDHDEALSSAEGYVQLRWHFGDVEPSGVVYELQEGRRPVFADTDTRYRGPATSSFVSGLEDGISYFRVRASVDGEATWSEWSSTVEVDVKHHDRNFALMLMALGGFVFLATAAFLIVHRNDPTPDGGSS